MKNNDSDANKHKAVNETLVNLYRFSIENAQISVFWVTPEGRFLYANNAACKKLGYKKDEMIGMNISNVDPGFPYERRPQFWREFKKVGVLKFESTHKTKSGKTFPVEITSHFLNYDGKDMEFAFALDITEKKRYEESLENSRKKLKAMLDAVPDLIFIVSRDGEYLDFFPSKTVEPVYPPSEFIGKNFWDTLPADIAEAQLGNVQLALESGNVINSEYRLDYGDAVYDFEVRFVKMGKDRALCLVRDITEKKKTDELMEKIRSELVEKNRQLETFAQRLTHDVKAPLNHIRGYLHLLKLKKKDPEETIERIDKEVGKLVDYANRLLKLAKAGRAIGPRKKTDLTLLILEVYNVFKSPVVKSRLVMDKDPVMVEIDTDGIKMMLDNLFDNSFKYRNPDTDEVVIEIGFKKRGDNYIINYKDNGIGMDKEKLQKIFKPGYTLNKNKGTGYGMFIVKNIVEAHGGDIQARSPGKGKGMDFEIKLPAK